MLSVRNCGEPRSAARLVPRDRVVPERIIKPDGAGRPGIQGGLHDAASRPDPLRSGRGEDRVARDAHLSRPKRRPGFGTRQAAASTTSTTPTSRGEVLVEAGQTIGEEQLILLRLEHEAAMGELSFGDKARRALGILAPGRGALLPGGSLHRTGASRDSSRTFAGSP